MIAVTEHFCDCCELTLKMMTYLWIFVSLETSGTKIANANRKSIHKTVPVFDTTYNIFWWKTLFLALHINPRIILLDITTCRCRIILLDIGTCPNYHVDALQQEIIADCQLGELANYCGLLSRVREAGYEAITSCSGFGYTIMLRKTCWERYRCRAKF